ncbi:hypothetical protein GOP47_0001647 [Adiantum capillus-veneris]|uniref:Uncharacterized protein n=1 Tax=Adiantum capillus-veneris TaxID=13818 RepID=A0A9D4V9C5_ADICA|nr:hypothetical protein GOP47_0001647 [Adiantum capillus-veneris]
MMAHVAPAEYAIHGREAPSYNATTEYYGGDYLPPQVPGDPMAFHRQQHQLSEDASVLADALAGIEIAQSGRGKPGPPHNKELVVHAIEAAASVLRDQASALRDQISENERLRSALRVREWELQNYQRIDQGVTSSHPENQSQDEYQALQQVAPNNQPLMGRELWAGNGFLGDSQSSLIVHPNVQSFVDNNYRFPSNGAQSQQYGSNFGPIGAIRNKNLPDGAFSHTSSPTARSMSPIRQSRDGDSGARVQPSGAVGNSQPRQELVKSTPRPQDEIKHLKKLLSDCTLKEMQLVHENHMLEKRLSELRLTIEKYQQELVDASSRETSVRQDVLEENARLTSEIRAARQEINFYASSLMPLLAEFNLQPATRDPHSIISGIKALVQHLREEARKDSGTPKQSWRNSQMYQQAQHGVSSSPVHHMSWVPKSPEPHGLEIVPQASYLQPERPLSPTSPLSHTPNDWESNPHHAFGTDNYSNENIRLSAYPAQGSEPQQINSRRIPADYNNSGLPQRSDSYNDTDEESNVPGHGYGPEYPERAERLSSQLPTVREEPSSSLSDEEDPLPDIEGLCINGDAVLGNKITACGISINGTTLCHFQWVRHHRDGSFFHIPGAAQPEYTITADDVDTRLSLECTPMDDRNRKGEMVQVFVNDHNRITIDQEMRDQIIEYLESGQANFEVRLGIENSQEVSFEPALLSLKRSIYELKKLNGKRVVGSERYASESAVEIKVGKDSQCAIINNTGAMHLLDCLDNRTRDLLVLTMREFIKAAIERKRGKKRLWLK